MMRELEVVGAAVVTQDPVERDDGDRPTLYVELHKRFRWLATRGVCEALDIQPHWEQEPRPTEGSGNAD